MDKVVVSFLAALAVIIIYLCGFSVTTKRKVYIGFNSNEINDVTTHLMMTSLS